MMKVYNMEERCSYKLVSEIICRSERTAARYIRRLRKAKGYSVDKYISIREFCEFYNITIS